MTSSVEIPQDIIDSIVAVIDDDYHGSRLLKTCALVSSSFLLPSRKRLFSRLFLRHEQACQPIHQFLVENPVVQSFVRKLTVNWGFRNLQSNGTSLHSILRLSFPCLESFSFIVENYSNWNDFSSELKDALLTIIHLPTLNTLNITGMYMPVMLFQGICLTKLVLHSVLPQFDHGKQPSLLPWTTSEGSHTVIDQCEWWFYEPLHGMRFPTPACFSESLIWDMEDLPGPTFLPLMSHLRVFEIGIHHNFSNTGISEFDNLPFLLRSLPVSLSSPATLENLKLYLEYLYDDNHDALFNDLRDAGVWSQLDSIITHPTGSRLQRVDINIAYLLAYEDVIGTREVDVVKPILDALPLLHKKGILFVKVAFRWC